MRTTLFPSVAFMFSFALLGSASAADRPIVVAELFTSQSCSSCPPAEAYFKTISTRPNVLALEWHVDYWDRLRTSDGAWKDPFSSAAHTARQRAYNLRLRGTAGVYTPQAIIQGAEEAVGSDKARIDRLIAAAKPVDPGALTLADDRGALRADFSGAPAGGALLLVRFRTEATTKVGGGENYGRSLASAHVVTHAEPIAIGGRFARPTPGEGCAVLLQESDTGPIRAAALCPA